MRHFAVFDRQRRPIHLQLLGCQIKQQLTAYLSQSPEVIQIELEPAAPGAHPWLQFAGMWADDPTWDDFVAEVAAYRQEMDKADAEA